MPNASGSQQFFCASCPHTPTELCCYVREQEQQKRDNDKVWEEFLDVLTGKRSSQECPTLEELDRRALNRKQLKAAQRALQHYQAIDEILFEGGLGEHAKDLEQAWRALCVLVTTTLRYNPELGSTMLPRRVVKDKKVAKPLA